MRYFHFILLACFSFNTAISATIKDTHTSIQDEILQCTSDESAEVFELNGKPMGIDATRHFAVFKTKNPNVFLVKDGVYYYGMFYLVEEWNALKTSNGNSTVFKSIIDSKKSVEVSNSNLSARHTTNWPLQTQCSNDPADFYDYWN